jgi:hypothetical protein
MSEDPIGSASCTWLRLVGDQWVPLQMSDHWWCVVTPDEWTRICSAMAEHPVKRPKSCDPQSVIDRIDELVNESLVNGWREMR